MTLLIEPLVVSTTSISDYRRCRKKYELAWIMNRDVPSSEVAERGMNFHEIMHAVARQDRQWLDEHAQTEMYPVALEYLQKKGFPRFDRILGAEDPIYTEVLSEVGRLPAVYIRSTHDLVYTDDHAWVVVKDYKTFTKAPTLNVDLDFQGRLYIAASMKHFQTDNVRFEYEYVRQELGRDLKGKGWVPWTDEERYITVPLLVPGHEIKQLWLELQYDCDDLRRKLHEPNTVWTRTDLKTGPHACTSCFHNQLCSAQLMQGGLTDDTLECHSTPRNPADRMTAKGILGDPRVQFHSNKAPLNDAIVRVYGQDGLALYRNEIEGVPA